MSNKNEVFEYLIDQLRQQLQVVDVMGEIKRWSIDRSIAGRGNYTDEENAIIDAYIGLEHNPYKQQCEDLAHEVQSLKNQLRDASAQIKELRADNIEKSRHISHLTGQSSAYRSDALRLKAQVEDLVKRLAKATGDVRGYIDATEQSGCRKEDAQESCWIEWSGGACPVPSGTLVDVIYRDGETLYGLRADEFNDTKRDASSSFWQHDGALNDIVRYRRALHQ